MDKYYYYGDINDSKDNIDLIFDTIKRIYEDDDEIEIYLSKKRLILSGELDRIIKFREKLKERFILGEIMKEYKLTITNRIEAEGKYIKQCCSGSYGHCKLILEPNEKGNGYKFIDNVCNDEIIPKEYIEAVKAGVKEALKKGGTRIFDIDDIKVTIYGGSYHQSDSTPMSFKIAGAKAIVTSIDNMNFKLLNLDNSEVREEASGNLNNINGFLECILVERGNLEIEKRYFRF